MSDTYDADFFAEQKRGSQRSARELVPVVLELIHPNSVVDVGCGVGAWLSVFKEFGVRKVLGIDGEWAEKHNELGEGEFIQRNLTSPIELDTRFDLVVCLEVAEHLPEAHASEFVRSLTGLGPVVLFAAAIPFQGGVLHVNEQWPEYWVRLFDSHGFACIDCLRSELWTNERVEWWFAQNVLLFVERSSPEGRSLLSGALRAVESEALPLVHPRNYLEKARRADIGLAEVLKMIVPLTRDAVMRRVRRILPGKIV